MHLLLAVCSSTGMAGKMFVYDKTKATRQSWLRRLNRRTHIEPFVALICVESYM